MSLVINTNYSATIAANNLAYSNSQLQNSLNSLSSGSKLYSSAADAGGTASAMADNSAALNDAAQLQGNANALSTLQTQDGALQVAGAIVTRMSQINALATAANGGTAVTGGGSSSYASEYTALQTELATAVSQGGMSALSAVAAGGANATSDISGALTSIAAARAVNGGSQSVDGFQNTLLTNNETNMQNQFSTVSDVDVEQASTQLAKWNVLVQAGTAMLAQANQSSQLALKLLG